MKRWLLAVVAVLATLLLAWRAGWLSHLGLGHRGAPGAERPPDLGAARASEDPADRARLAGREKATSVEPSPAVTGPRITGRVVDASGRGVPRARVISLPDTNLRTLAFEDYGKAGAPGHAVSTDPEGRFVVAASTDAPYFLVAARAPGFAPTLQSARLPPSPRSQRAAPSEDQKRFGAETRVLLRGSDGRILVDVRGVSRMFVGTDGQQLLRPGRYTARIEFPDGDSREEEVDLLAGGRVTVRFRRR